jgi:hypothetical protein
MINVLKHNNIAGNSPSPAEAAHTSRAWANSSESGLSVGVERFGGRDRWSQKLHAAIFSVVTPLVRAEPDVSEKLFDR